MTDPSRWPNLKLPTHPVLDWVETVYEATWLQDMAARIEAGALLKEWTPATAAVLRALADNPAALGAVNSRRPLPPRDVVGLNRAVHFLVRHEICGRMKEAMAKVAACWGVSVATIQEDRTMFRVVNLTEYRERDAQRIFDFIVNGVMVSQGKTRDETLAAFDADMQARAAQLLGVKP